MSGSLLPDGPGAAGPARKSNRAADYCSLIVLYEDQTARTRAVGVCDRLIQRFWQDIEFKIEWCNFKYLAAEEIARPLADLAARADIVVYAAGSDQQLPAPVERWTEHWLSHRKERHGMLVALVGEAAIERPGNLPLHQWLCQVARRASMDFLPPMPEAASDNVSAVQRERLQKQATQMGQVLRDILRRPVTGNPRRSDFTE